MIKITQIRPAAKVSGLEGWLVDFPYREDIVAAMGQLPNAYYHKKQKLWEIPSSSLQEALDTLTFLDDIQVSVLDDAPEIPEISPLTDAEIKAFKVKPFDHQLVGINYMLAHPKSLLLDSMGVGKTNEIIWTAEVLHRRGLISHCLIVCGVNAVKQNWKKEIQTFSNETVRILGEKVSKKGRITYAKMPDRVAEITTGISEFFLITNIESLRDEHILKALTNSGQFQMVAVDEIHKCLTGDTKIETDIGTLSIKELSELKDLPKVRSYNKTKDCDGFAQILSVSKLAPTEPILELTFLEADTVKILKCTESHKIYTTNRGWVKAKDLTENDDIKIVNHKT